jgi:hypothetical protein
MIRNYLITSLLIFTITGISLGQTQDEVNRILKESDVVALQGLAAVLGQKQAANLALALQLAPQKGWVVRSVSPDGKVMELQGVDAHGNPLYYTTDNINAAKTISTDKVWPGGGIGLSLTGTGMTLREWDEGQVLATHQELTPRATQGDAGGSLSDHSTHVAGTMIASGVVPAAHGMSYQASLKFFNWTSDLSEMTTEGAAGALLSNSSYGYICGWYYNGSTWTWYGDPAVSNVEDYKFGFYSANARDVDDIVFNAPYYLPCKSAGNDRGDYNGSGPQEMDGGADGFDCVSDWGCSKNVLTVGAVYDIPGGYTAPSDVVMSSFSGWGPTDDGRIKPDVVANGMSLYSTWSGSTTAYGVMSGTSMATPSACGSLMLLQQHYNNLNAVFMRASTLKALAIHTADEAGGNPGPDFSFGWGLLNISKAAQVISQKDQVSKIIETTLSNGGTYTLNVTSAGTEPLRVTLCWTDRKGTPTALLLNPPNIMLVNDLDLRVDGTSQPWKLNPASPSTAATTGDNTRDNVEQVYIASPSAGSHAITVTHKGTLSGGSQNFSMIVTGIYTGVADPSPFTATGISGTEIDLNWTKNPSNNDVLLAWSPTGTFGTPVNGTTYTAGNTITGGGTVLYAGPNSTFPNTGLSSNTIYYYRIWSVNGSANYSYGKIANAVTPCIVYNSFPISENFNSSSSLPSCWSQASTGGTSDWSISGTNFTGGSGNELMATYSTTTSGTTRCKTFFFNTTGATSLDLTFNHMFDDYAAGCTAKIQTSTDGITWTDEAWSIASGGGNIGPLLVTTTITHNLNSPTTMVAFVVTGNLYNFDYWHIDNVTIKAAGYWIGGTAGNLNNWNTATNWGDGLVPTAASNVVITPRTYMPVITNDPASPAQCNNMVIVGTATVTVNTGKKIVVNGSMTIQAP